jgi:hypothetical protein
LSEHKWQIGPVKLANGEDAFIDAINEGQEAYRYTGRMKLYNQWAAVGWDESGREMYSEIDSPGNLAPPPKKTVRVERWMVVYPSGKTQTFTDKAEAIFRANKFGFALIEINREVEEGEGL